jgi:hypothetical protein
MRLLADAVQPVRLQMAELEQQLLTSGRLDARRAAVVRKAMDSAFSSWEMALFAAAIPKIVLRRLLKADLPMPELPSGEDGVLYQRFIFLCLLSAAAANPIFTIVVFFESLVFAPLEAMVEYRQESNDCDSSHSHQVWRSANMRNYSRPSGRWHGVERVWKMLTSAALDVSLIAFSQ